VRDHGRRTERRSAADVFIHLVSTVRPPAAVTYQPAVHEFIHRSTNFLTNFDDQIKDRRGMIRSEAHR
jgi:hypothetical protein